MCVCKLTSLFYYRQYRSNITQITDYTGYRDMKKYTFKFEH